MPHSIVDDGLKRIETKSYRSWSHSGALSRGASDSPDLQSHALGARQDKSVCLPVRSLVRALGYRLRVLASTLIKIASEVFTGRAITFKLFPPGSHQNRAQPVISRSLSSFLHSGRTLAADLCNLLKIRTVERPEV